MFWQTKTHRRWISATCNIKHPSCQNPRVRKAASCDEIRPEILDALTKYLCIILVIQMAWPYGKVLKIDKLCWSSTYTRREAGWNSLTTGKLSCMSYLEKCMPNPLKKGCCEIVEPGSNKTQDSFRPSFRTTGVCTDQNFIFQHIFEKSWDYARNFCAFFLTRKAHGGFGTAA